MDWITFIFQSAFAIMNLRIKIPLNIEQTNVLEFPIYVLFVVAFIIEIIKALWIGVIINRNGVD